jgi:hypothetical protein
VNKNRHRGKTLCLFIFFSIGLCILHLRLGKMHTLGKGRMESGQSGVRRLSLFAGGADCAEGTGFDRQLQIGSEGLANNFAFINIITAKPAL